MTLEGRGDARRADWMRKCGYEEIGYNRTYETMVFRAGDPCESEECGCMAPTLGDGGREIEVRGYNGAKAATLGHRELCERYAMVQEVAR